MTFPMSDSLRRPQDRALDTRALGGLAEIADDFDAFLIDQFGTLHDGQRPYPGAIDALRTLRQRSKRVILLSNSGGRARYNERRLMRLNVSRDCYDDQLSAGEAGLSALHENPPACLRRHCRVFLIAREPTPDLLEGFDVELTDAPGCADLVLIAGRSPDLMHDAALERALEHAAARGVLAICTNSDRYMLEQGSLEAGPGALAERYALAGGRVLWLGKPYDALYRAAFALLPDIPRSRICCIGDSLEHDVVGGNRVGCGTCLVFSGVSAHLTRDALREEGMRLGARPSFLLPCLAWNPG